MVLILMAVPAQAGEYRILEVLPNIMTVMPQSPNDGNSTFITTPDGVIVIDTRLTQAGGEQVKEEIKKLTSKPVVYVINSHFHEENMTGNLAFSETKTIIAHKKTQEILLERIENEKLKIRVPNLVFENQMDLALGGFRLKLIHPGPAHTKGDLYIYLPSWRTIITGALVFNKVIPDMSDGYIDLWVDALQEMEDLDAELIVPGHGQPGGKPLVTQMKHYLMQLKRWVNDRLDDGKNLKTIRKEVSALIKQRYGHWKHQDRIDANIQRAFFEYSAKRGT